jgi:hypothetical protein
VGAWGVGLTGALLFGCGLPWPVRLGGVLLLAACLRGTVMDLAGRRGRLVLGADGAGRWWLRRGGGGLEYVQLAGRPLLLGDLLWLRFRNGRRRTFLFIDGRRAEPAALRRLKVILLLDPGGTGGRTEAP